MKVLFRRGNDWEVAELIVGREDDGVFVLSGRSHLVINVVKRMKA